MALTYPQVTAYITANNHSPFTTELIAAICWAESSFDPDSASGSSTAAGLMMMTQGAIATVNNTTPPGTHFESADMSDPAKAIACGTYYLQWIYDNAGGQNKRETLKYYRGATDYTYADKAIACESCLQVSVVLNPQTCLNQIHS